MEEDLTASNMQASASISCAASSINATSKVRAYFCIPELPAPETVQKTCGDHYSPVCSKLISCELDCITQIVVHHNKHELQDSIASFPILSDVNI